MLTVKQREQLEFMYREVDEAWAKSILFTMLGKEDDFYELLKHNTLPFDTYFDDYPVGLEICVFNYKNTKGYLSKEQADKFRKLLIPFPRLVYSMLSDANNLGVFVDYGIMDDIVELGPTDDYLRKELEYVIRNSEKEGEEYNLIIEVV